MNEDQKQNRPGPKPLTSSQWLAKLARPGNGEMGGRVAGFDWSGTPLGSPSQWSQSLKARVETLLSSQYPMVMTWGPQFTQFYNDGYSKFIGTKHPGALGDDIRVTLGESWDVLGPMINRVMETGIANWTPALLLLLERSGYREESYFSVSHAPAEDDFGEIVGMLAVCSEVTQQVLSERRLKLLSDLAATAGAMRNPEDTCRDIAEAISGYRLDIPFAMIYLRDQDGTTLQLCGSAGLDDAEPITPFSVDSETGSHALWPFERAASGETVLVEHVDQFVQLPGGPWDDAVHQALAIPIAASGKAAPLGVFIVAINPNRALDEGYQSFYELLAGQVSASVRNAHAYEEERKRSEALAQLDQAKTAFFSNVSHEFRTPLTLLLGPMEDMLSSSREEELRIQRAPLESAYRNGLRLLKLVNTLLDFSRVEAGRVQAAYEQTDLATYTRELASNFQSAIERAGLEFKLTIAELSEPVFVDREMWEKIVLNLLSNALKYTFEGEIEVRLGETENNIELSVRDTGTGIPEDVLPKIFERFHRVEGARSRSYEGSGIGLALVQELAKLHQGSAGVQSVFGEGSTFVVSIPKGSAHLPVEKVQAIRALESTRVDASAYTEEASTWLPAKDEQPSPSPDQAVRPHVLLVDDNADMRAYVARLLEARYEVETAANGRVALEAIAARRPDLVLSDVMMPELNGFELLKALREDQKTRRIPFILLSARAGQESTVVGIEAGADDYLVKPFSAKELLARVHQHLTMARLRQEYESEHEIRQRIEESEKRFRTLAEAIPQIVWTTQPDGTVDYCNVRWFDYTGLDWEQSKGWGWKRALHPDDLDRTDEQWTQAMNTGQTFVSEHRLKRASNDDYRWHLIRAIPVHDHQGNVVQWFGTATDIQDQKQAIEMRDEFLSVASHELKTPITSLKLQLQMSRKRIKLEENLAPASEKLAHSLDISLRQADRLTGLVDDLLDVSRIQAGKLEMNFEEVHVQELIAEVVHRYQFQLEAAKCPVELELDATLTGKWNKVRIEQVMINLLSNAAKYASGKTIRISARKDGEMGILAIEDQGPGVVKDKQILIFERFERAVSSMNISGLGLGLFVSKNIVQGHHGSLRVESERGEGSTFIVELPLDPERFKARRH